MAFWSKINLFSARRQKAPKRDTDEYPRLMSLGRIYNQKAHRKPIPPNMRYFSRTIYARRAVNCLKNPIANLKWEIIPHEDIKLNSELQNQIDIATNCFKHPNIDDSFTTLIEQIVEDYCIFGAGVIEQQLGNDPTRPIWFWPVDAQSIQIYLDWDGTNPNQPRYLQTIGYNSIGIYEATKLRNDELIYMRANPSSETPYGYGAIEIAFATINRLLCVESYSGDLAGNAQPQAIMYLGDYDDVKLRSFRSFWQNEVEGRGVLPFIAGKTEPHAIPLHTGTDSALYLEYQNVLRRSIATAFGISPQNLGLESDVNRNTSEVAEDRDWDQAIKPLAYTIQSYLTREALHAKLGFYQLEFKFNGLDREDEESIANIAKIYYENNMMTPNEHREKLGMPPLNNEWADKCYADMLIAQSAARGTKVVDDSDLPKIKTQPQSPSPSPTATPKSNKNKSPDNNENDDV